MSDHPDKNGYERIWMKIIKPEIESYQNKFYGHLELIPDVKDAIWQKYIALNEHCKKKYMKDPMGKIDRHKVSACYLIAISSVKPLRIKDKEKWEAMNSEAHFVLNEQLAITVGFSILSAYIIKELSNNAMEKDEALIKKIEQNGIHFPSAIEVHHGEYLNNYTNELFYTVEEGNINILSVAHELYLLELLTRGSKSISE